MDLNQVPCKHIHDPSGRPVKNIRISINEECNLGCYYCHGEGHNGGSHLLSPEEIGRILEVAESLGIEKVKITGGEPLARKDIVDVVKAASKHMREVSMTTNGTLLAPYARELKQAGLDRVNISLDTVNRERYQEITGTDMLHDALEGISAAVQEELVPVKANIVALDDSTLEDIMGTVETVWRLGGIPQIIEPVAKRPSALIADVEDHIAERASNMRERKMHRRRVYSMQWGGDKQGNVEIVRPMHNTVFCANCTRIRVTSDGMLKACLMHNEKLVDILTPLRNGASIEELQNIFKKAVSYREPYWK